MNGYFQLITEQNSTKIKIVPPTGDGSPLEYQDVADYLSQRKIPFDVKRLGMAVIAGKEKETIEVLNLDHFLMERESYILKASPDMMHLTAKFYAPSVGGELMSVEEFLNDLSAKKVKHGINAEAIKGFFANRDYCKEIEVATGTEPRHGTDAWIEYFFNIDPTAKPTLKEDGSVDFFQLNNVNHIKKGDILARLHPEDAGEPGRSIFGEPVKPRDVKRLTLKFGRNIEINEEKTILTALVDGHATYADERVFLSDVLTLENVDVSTGNIEYDGNVRINGNVNTNFVVKCKGNINVGGVVEGAILEAGGDITLSRGMNGMGRGVLKADGNIVAKFMENAKASAGGYVMSESILHSTVTAGTDVTVTGKRGFITGGKVSASTSVQVRTLGSEMGADTEIEVGADPRLKLRIQELQKNIVEIDKVLKTAQPVLVATKEKLAKGVKIPPDQLKYVQQMGTLVAQKTQEMKDATEELEVLTESLDDVKAASVQVQGTVYPGTKITIGDVSMTVRSEMKYCRFIKEAGDVKMTAL